jgi:hypothetical protein
MMSTQHCQFFTIVETKQQSVIRLVDGAGAIKLTKDGKVLLSEMVSVYSCYNRGYRLETKICFCS